MKVYAALNLNVLADTLIEEIGKDEVWPDPFSSPVVIFADGKMEQWFKLRWLKTNLEKKSVLLNLKTARLESFLVNVISSGESGQFDILSVEILRDYLIQKLSTKTAGTYYFERLNSSEVSSYLFDQKDGVRTLNLARLYDFSKEIAALFLDYEVTRPAADGKAAFWDMLPAEKLAKNSWQRQLYEDVFCDDGLLIHGRTYVTLPQLVKRSRSRNNGKILFKKSANPHVCLFGFSGMGQMYRNILLEYAETAPLSVFIQTPPLSEEKLSECKNPLLAEWAQFGIENLTLWGCPEHADTAAAAVPAAPAAPADASEEPSLLSRVHAAFAAGTELPHLTELKSSECSLTLTAAPTKLREVEAVHSKICELLADKQTQLGDILVLAPQMQEYAVAVEQVFDQQIFDTDLKSSDEKKFPNIPYVIADASAESSLTAQALTVLFTILQKGYLCRADLFALLRNPLVQVVRGISGGAVDSWSEWAAEMHIYRDRGGTDAGGACTASGRIDDWNNAKTRLLLSRLTDELYVKDAETEFLPYKTIDTEDDNSLNAFIDAIDELESWTALARDTVFDAEKINKIEAFLRNWLLPGTEPPDNLESEPLIFQSVLQEIKNQKLIGGNAVFRECFLYAVMEAARSTSIHSSAILSSGITFADFKANRILSAKYVFLLGFDSKAFPGLDSENVLDLRTGKKEKGDDSIPAHNKNAFLCQLMAAEKGFFISYVNKNLQKDEDFYRSSIVENLFGALYWKTVSYEAKLRIDEDRNWDELFTPRSFRNKENYLRLQRKWDGDDKRTAGGIVTDGKGKQQVNNYPDRVTISQIRKFLRDPFQFMVNTVFSGGDDDSDEERLEFEPLGFNTLTSSNLRKKYIRALLENQFVTDAEFRQQLKIENILPDGHFGDAAFEDLKNASSSLTSVIQMIFGDSEIDFENNKDVLLRQNISVDEQGGVQEKEWLLRGNRVWFNKDFEKTKRLCTVEIGSDCLAGYITALSLLASLQHDEAAYYVSLNRVKSDGNPEEQTMTMGPAQARQKLHEIYDAMFVERFRKCVPYGLCETELQKLSDLENELNGFTGGWGYFAQKDLFDIYSDIGYTEADFEKEWQAAQRHQRRLIAFLDENAGEKDSGEAE